MKGIFLIYDVFMAVIASSIIYVFYKIFVNGLVVIKNIKLKNAFSIEELIGATIIIAIAGLSLNSINIYNLNIVNIIIMFMIMVLGLKNGILLGRNSWNFNRTCCFYMWTNYNFTNCNVCSFWNNCRNIK